MAVDIDESTFRFHTGSIKSPVGQLIATATYAGFDSILVRLKDESTGYARHYLINVSIPYWFD